MNEVTEILGCEYPVIQGAMLGISSPEFVAAVSEAGGFGLLATGLKDTLTMRREIQAVQALTDKPFGMNIQTWPPTAMTMAELAVEMKLRAVTLSAGSPVEICRYLKGQGVKSIAVVPNLRNATTADRAGVDAIVAEGTESGGVQGYDGVSTLVIVPMVVDAVSVPVLAAGGIADSRGYRAAMALGAQGVQVGTRFIASEECPVHQNIKDVLCQTKENETILFPQSKRTNARLLSTPLVNRFLENPKLFDIEKLRSSRRSAWDDGDLESGFISFGQIAGMITDVKPVKEIIREMVGPGD